MEEDCGGRSHTGHQSVGDGGDCEDMERRRLEQPAHQPT